MPDICGFMEMVAFRAFWISQGMKCRCWVSICKFGSSFLDGNEGNTDRSESRSLSREGPCNVLCFRIILSSSMCWSYCCMWMLGEQKSLWDGRNWLWSSLIVKLVAIVVEIEKRDFMICFGKCVFLKVPLEQLLGNTFIVFSEFLGPLVKPTIWYWCLFKL